MGRQTRPTDPPTSLSRSRPKLTCNLPQFHVGLDAAHRVLTDNAVEDGANDDFDDSLLPLPHLTPVTLLGGTDEKREATGQLLTVQIASLISARNKDESRMVTVGLGLGVKELDQQAFMEILELVGKCV